TRSSAAACPRPSSACSSAARRAYSRCSRRSRRADRHGSDRDGRLRAAFLLAGRTTAVRTRLRDPGPNVRTSRALPFAYFAKLSAADKRAYRASDAIERLDLPEGFAEGAAVDAI